MTGKVTYDNKSVPTGTVIFTSADGKKSSRADIQTDGSYKAGNVPVGEVGIAVVVVQLAGKMPDIASKAYQKFGKDKGGEGAKMMPGGVAVVAPKIPEKYADAKTSGLKMTARTVSVWPFSIGRFTPVRTSQTMIGVPPEWPVTSARPSGLKARHRRLPLRVSTGGYAGAPVARFQMIKVPSSLAEARSLPSGLKATS